jgi:hypothetical protein
MRRHELGDYGLSAATTQYCDDRFRSALENRRKDLATKIGESGLIRREQLSRTDKAQAIETSVFEVGA